LVVKGNFEMSSMPLNVLGQDARRLELVPVEGDARIEPLEQVLEGFSLELGQPFPGGALHLRVPDHRSTSSSASRGRPFPCIEAMRRLSRETSFLEPWWSSPVQGDIFLFLAEP
jgi:hypothetical protein